MIFNEFIINNETVIDGAMSTALEKLGYNTQNELWTAAALIDRPDLIYKVHYDYLKAGADLIMTDTYQANIMAFEKKGYSELESKDFITKAIKIAHYARDDYEKKTGRHAYIAGTIGPYGAYLADGNEYKGDYNLSFDQYNDFFYEKIKLIIEAGVDVIGVETQPKLSETKAILKIIQKFNSQIPLYISYTLKDATHISDGTSLSRAVANVVQNPSVLAVGINCTKLEIVEPALHVMRRVTNKPLLVYPNTSAKYDAKTKKWVKPLNKRPFENYIAKWYDAGAQLIGGCCTTLPKEIKEIAHFVNKMHRASAGSRRIITHRKKY